MDRNGTHRRESVNFVRSLLLVFGARCDHIIIYYEYEYELPRYSLQGGFLLYYMAWLRLLWFMHRYRR